MMDVERRATNRIVHAIVAVAIGAAGQFPVLVGSEPGTCGGFAQEVFIRGVNRAREDYIPARKFTTWLFRIATNLR